MTLSFIFPAFENWEATKATLHAYSKVVGAVPRTHALAHPKWWHISLKVRPEGLVTETMALPGGGIFALKMNLLTHRIQLNTSRGEAFSWPMNEGWSANQMAEQILGTVARLGLEGDYARQKFENDEPRAYDPAHAATYFSVLVNVAHAFQQHRATLSGEVGPVQLWPHGFDLAFEWFGTRQVEYEEHGEKTSYPSQINLGFSPGEPNHPQPYFYSNPFPFDAEQLTDQALPHGARWFTEGWQGSLLEYATLMEDADGIRKLRDYARTVYELASPGLMA